jgi:tetratricopeptide (TPR) repeat protein
MLVGLIPYIIISVVAVIVVAFGAVVISRLFFAGDKGKKKKRQKKIKVKDRNKIIRETNRRLAQNPKDPEALLALAELYYTEAIYDKSLAYYSTLMGLCGGNSEINEFDVTVRYGLSALKLGNQEAAYKSLIYARTLEENNFELCYHLGYLEYLRKEFEKAISLLRKAAQLEPEHVQTVRLLGHAFFKNSQYNEAAEELRKAVDFEPNDKESLFVLAQCHYEQGKNDRALNIFTHLRLDSSIGPKAALFAGTIHLNGNDYPKAIMDFEIGLKHKEIRPEIALELKYRLAAAYIKQSDMNRALSLLEDVYMLKPDYKDVGKLIGYYRELLTNKDLQVFLLAPPSEFLTLCRRIATNYFEAGKTKLINITLNKSEYADILAEVHTRRWEDMIMFRFVRTNGVVGELVVRDFYTICKENRAGRGFCITPGEFTEGAKQFVEARLIDLIDKDEIFKLFKRITINSRV